MSEKLTGRILSEETRKKIGNAHRGKVYGEETREKISKARQKLRKIEKILILGKSGKLVLLIFLKLFPNENYTEAGLRSAAKPGRNPYKGIFKVTDL